MGAVVSELQAQTGRRTALSTIEPADEKGTADASEDAAVAESKWLRLWPVPAVVAVLLVVADQGTKELVRATIPRHGQVEVIPGCFNLVHVYNKGAAWGMFGGHTFLLGLVSLAVFLWIALKFRYVTEGWVERGVALSLLLGGVFGNLIDRFFREEGVVDFFSVYYQRFEWPAFNIADSAICVGVGIFVLSSFLRPHPKAAEAVAAEAETGS